MQAGAEGVDDEAQEELRKLQEMMAQAAALQAASIRIPSAILVHYVQGGICMLLVCKWPTLR